MLKVERGVSELLTNLNIELTFSPTPVRHLTLWANCLSVNPELCGKPTNRALVCSTGLTTSVVSLTGVFLSFRTRRRLRVRQHSSLLRGTQQAYPRLTRNDIDTAIADRDNTVGLAAELRGESRDGRNQHEERADDTKRQAQRHDASSHLDRLLLLRNGGTHASSTPGGKTQSLRGPHGAAMTFRSEQQGCASGRVPCRGGGRPS